jgi:hypothetical protein
MHPSSAEQLLKIKTLCGRAELVGTLQSLISATSPALEIVYLKCPVAQTKSSKAGGSDRT